MNLGELARILVRGRQLVCESCGAPFQCRASLRGCWCSQVPLAADARRLLRERYRDCLCPECLKRAAAAAPAAGS